MTTRWNIGQEAGQRYDVADAIRTFLKQMAEHTSRVVPAVVKELLQNADDAGATRLDFLLDERHPPEDIQPGQEALFLPGLIIRNNAPFKTREDVAPGQLDDFEAICKVASGHKAGQVIAAGRYGLGFNSVYFLTDTPILFSRREVHIFDVARTVMPCNGWRFGLQEFPAAAGSDAGAIKAALEWMLPKVALGEDRSFAEFAADPSADYRQTVVRLPLRCHGEGRQSVSSDSFPTEADRFRALDDAVEHAVRSMLFLKNVQEVRFSVLRDVRKVEEYARVDVTPNPETFRDFLTVFDEVDEAVSRPARCNYQRTVTVVRGQEVARSWSFHVFHDAPVRDAELLETRTRLKRNEEKAVPWVSLAIPLDSESVAFDGDGDAAWRVFLPLGERGPSKCLFNAALFVGPSRQKCEYRTDGSDESSRKTLWNQQLVRIGLVPLLREASADMLTLVPELARSNPADYVALFPEVWHDKAEPTTLAEYFQQEFCRKLWFLQVPDLWDEPLDLEVSADGVLLTVLLIPKLLEPYRDRFRDLSGKDRRMVRYALGALLRPRLPAGAQIEIVQDLPQDVVSCVLRHETPPRGRDLAYLLDRLVGGEDSLTADLLEGLWCFQVAGSANLLRYDGNTAYVLSEEADGSSALACLSGLDLRLAQVEYVDPKVGLPAAMEKRRRAISNMVPEGEDAVLEVLRRVNTAVGHDSLTSHRKIIPLIDLLCTLDPHRLTSDLRLSFLVKTATSTSSRRVAGALLLRSPQESQEDQDVAETFLVPGFPGLDPEFSKEIHRLLAHAPGLLRSLSDSKCDVAYARADGLLELLLRAQGRDPGLASRLAAALNRPHAGRGPDSGATERAMTALFAQADRTWEDLSAGDRLAFLSLPVHRFADGTYGPMVETVEELDHLADRVYLQSKEDLRDAPIELPGNRLLQTVVASTKGFYRERIGLRWQDRNTVLCEVLRQIGDHDEKTNGKLLRYLEAHYRETVRHLERSVDKHSRTDLETTISLFAKARLVPCTDRQWRSADECVDGHILSVKLLEQGWRIEDHAQLLARLFPDRAILTLDAIPSRAVRALCELDALSADALAESAVSSESPELELETRARILAANWESRPREPKPAEAVRALKVPCTHGLGSVESAEIVDSLLAAKYSAVVSVLVPFPVDLGKCTDRFGLQGPRVVEVLGLFGVPPVGPGTLADRLVRQFQAIWPGLSTGARLQVIGFVADQHLAEPLRRSVSDLPVVQVPGKDIWVTPVQVVSPSLLEADPPLVEKTQRGAYAAGGVDMRTVLESWAGVRELRDLVSMVCARAATALPAQREAVGRDVVAWVGRLLAREETDPARVGLAFRDHAWVPARRGFEREFRRASDVLFHTAHEVLAHGFWVPDLELPAPIRKDLAGWQFQLEPPSDGESLAVLAECLVHSGEKNPSAATQTYKLLATILEERPDLADEWAQLLLDRPVFRCFRRPERVVKRLELYMGSGKGSRDFGDVLLCLRAAEKLPRGLEVSYRALGIEELPTPGHLLHALANLDGSDGRSSQARMQVLRRLKDLEPDRLSVELLACRVKTCAGTYAPVGEVYWDEELGTPEHASPGSAKLLVDATDHFSAEFVSWVEQIHPAASRRLRLLSRARLVGVPEVGEETQAVLQVLGPWKDWLDYLHQPDGNLRSEAEDLSLAIPDEPIQIRPVNRIDAAYELPGGATVAATTDWEGRSVITNGPAVILVRASVGEGAGRADGWLAKLDGWIAEELSCLLCKGDRPTAEEMRSCVDLARRTLERPSVVLKQLDESQGEHFLHQYQDQFADEEFALVFDQYSRTKKTSEKYGELVKQLWHILTPRYVQFRRQQIRGHGYDEFSVFAELIQNAEDAYVQRTALGMPEAAYAAVRFAYLSANGGVLLRVEHYGRPFNYWRHGSREDARFRRDVQGVIRSAGSYKSTGRDSTETQLTVGRFGLGFKSVYLITDEPAIHSGDWHFRIQQGCRAIEMDPPGDLEDEATRFDLPLRADVKELIDDSGIRLATLMPFLRRVEQVDLRNADGGAPLCLRLSSVPVGAHREAGAYVELVEVHGASHMGHTPLRLLRVRHTDHQGQLGLYLGADGMPAKWNEAFQWDLYVVLPLKTRLGVGVGVSSNFDIQSGRTHLVGSFENEDRFVAVASLVRSLPDAIRALPGAGGNPSETLSRFWSLWHWEGADEEVTQLRKRLARAVALLPLDQEVVPLVQHGAATNLAVDTVLFFSGVPDGVRDILIEERCPWILSAGARSTLDSIPVTTSMFAEAYRAACRAGGEPPSAALVQVDWESIGANLALSGGLAENPTLLNRIAGALPELKGDEERRRATARKLLVEVPVALDAGGVSVTATKPGEAFAPDLQGRKHLPTRLMRILSPEYSEDAVALLRGAGLRSSPSGKEIRDWMESGELTHTECLGLIRYFAEEDRWMNVQFRGLDTEMRSPWVVIDGPARLSAADAADRFLGPEVADWDDKLRLWLGLEPSWLGPTGRVDQLSRPVDAGRALEKLYTWWTEHGTEWVTRYEEQTYPSGQVPDLGNANAQDRVGRERWLTVLLLGSLHTLGRMRREQHRSFLEQCKAKGWMDVFTERPIRADRWMIDVLKGYLEEQTQDVEYYHWMRQFVSIYQLTNWLGEYVAAFRAIGSATSGFACDSITAPRSAPLFQGGGSDAPPITRVLGMGVCFVIREMCRTKVLTNRLAHEHCYVPSLGVRNLLQAIGFESDMAGGSTLPAVSKEIHKFLVRHLGPDRAIFGGSFDLPLVAMGDRTDVWEEIMATARG